ncbi:hypothetical protein M9Y10_015830 [Tritrichomonas musculus]|uniref:Right handed beta helix domain-containing protein n=1 Tax=Tritrichomonas musculus TaxID=1915356 RepID=A0ABR2I6B5_9EUKA
MKPLWNVESDGIGGLREWANENSHTAQPKTMTLQFSKIWVYGSTRDIHGGMMFKIDDKEILINQNTTTRVDGVLVYESDYLPLKDYTISFSQHVEDCVFNNIFYLPIAEPTPVPISVPIEQMTITGKHGVVGHGCPKDKFPTEPCGSAVWYNPASQSDNPAIITYKFKGERFQIYGKYDDSHGIYTLYLDDKLVKEISQVGSQDSTNQLQYTSELLPCDEHTIKIVCNTGEFELYKFAYWPFSNAKRVNSTDMKPLWNVESDGIGGLREWANENSHTAQPKTMTLQFSKIWVYGSTRDIHGDMMFKIDDKEILINQNTTTSVDGVLVYESDLIPFGNHTISFSQHVEDCIFNGFYYHTLPEPEPDKYILDDGNCNENHRCEKKATNPNQNIQVYVKVTKFNGFNNDDNGGAIHIVDAALKVNQSDIDKCTSNNGGGGAIYVSNSYEITNEYLFESLKTVEVFNECSAKYGGAVYIYASSKKISASITRCFFKGNEAVGTSSDDKFGGSAIFMSVFNGYLLCNKFRGNKGQVGSVKLINDFKPSSNSLRVLSNEGFVLISKCEFQIEENSDCSLFYLRGNNGPSFEVSNCKFSGSLAKDSHFIDGMAVSTSSPQLVVRSCRFASDFKKGFTFDRSNSFLKIDKDSQVFESKGSYDKM